MFPPPSIHWVHYSFDDIEHNLALDEALLELAEDDLQPKVRVWKQSHLAIVLGASCKLKESINLDKAQDQGIAIARRSSGGGTVIVGPGALNAAIVCPIAMLPEFQAVDSAQKTVLEFVAQALRDQGSPVEMRGSGDLAIDGKKFSGSAQRRKKRFFMIHATFLLDFDLDLIDELLSIPQRQPSYRANRSHRDFLTNLLIPETQLVEAIAKAWTGQNVLDHALSTTLEPEWHERVNQLCRLDPAWVARF